MQTDHWKRNWLRAALIPFIATLVWFVPAGCHNGRGSTEVAENPQAGGGGAAPNGSDPKQAPIRGTPTASIAWTATQGAASLGVGIRGYVQANPQQSLQATSTTVFEFQPLFSMEEGNAFSYNESNTAGWRTHGESNSWSVGVSGGSPWFKAGVSYRQSRDASFSGSTRDFRGDVRLLKQRNFISLASGHYSLRQDVMNRLANATSYWNSQNWAALQQERASFEAVYGSGFVSEHVLGHTLDIRAYINETSNNTLNVSSFGVNFRSAFVSGDFSTFSATMTSAGSSGFSISINSMGLTSQPSNIADWINKANNFVNNLAAPTTLWVGCVRYSELPGFAVMYDAVPGTLNVSVDTPVVSQSLQIPVLGEVGELVSLGSWSPNSADSVWMSPYLFPGDYTTSNGNLNLNVRIFDIYKQLCRDLAFRQIGDQFLATCGYPDAKAAKSVVMPESTGGPNSTFVEHVGAYYKTNVTQIRPVLGIVDPITSQVTTVLQSNLHWQSVSTMGLDGFGGPGTYGGPGSNACGLFFGAGPLTFSFADPNGDAVLAAQQGRLRMFTEVARGATSVRLSQSKLVNGQFGVDIWDPSQTWNPDPYAITSRVYPGNKKVVLIRWPVQADWTVGMNNANQPMWAQSATIFNWGESQDVIWTFPGYYCGAFGRIPIMNVQSMLIGSCPTGNCCTALYPGSTDQRGFLNPSIWGPPHTITMGGNGLTNATNVGSYQCILMLGQ